MGCCEFQVFYYFFWSVVSCNSCLRLKRSFATIHISGSRNFIWLIPFVTELLPGLVCQAAYFWWTCTGCRPDLCMGFTLSHEHTIDIPTGWYCAYPRGDFATRTSLAFSC